jgi:glycogen synthase
MRILTVSNLYPPHYVGGYELRCRQTVEALRSRGHTVRVLTSDYGVPTAAPDPGDPEIRRALRINGFFGRPWLGIRDLAGLEIHNNRALISAADDWKPDVVHVWNLGGISKSLIFTLARLGVPTAYDISDHWIARSLKADVWLDWWNRANPSPAARALRFFWSVTGARRKFDAEAPTNPVRQARFKRIYFCSAALRSLTVEAGYDVRHGGVIHCAVDIEKFAGDPAPAEQPVRRLLYVGRLAEDKGVMTALRAMKRLEPGAGLELHVYGRGDEAYTRALHQFAADNALPVHFSSAKADEMPAVYRAHDALLFTSEWEEPFALTPLEAMASGLPVIGTTTGGSKELLRDGENSLTYQAGDDGQLADRVRTLAADPSLRARIAAEGKRGVARFAEGLIMNQIEEFLIETIRSWRPEPPPAFDAP